MECRQPAGRQGPGRRRAEDHRLTPEQEAFCRAWCRHFNAARAAREIGVAPERAAAVGYRMRRKPAIGARIDQLLARRVTPLPASPRVSSPVYDPVFDTVLQRLIDAAWFPVELFFRPRPIPPELGACHAPLPCDLSRLSAGEIAVITRLEVSVHRTRDGGVAIAGEFRGPDRIDALRRLMRHARPAARRP